MNRQGFAFVMLLLSAGAAGMLATLIVANASDRATSARGHAAQVQGREWCLGAQQLPPGRTLTLGGWTVARGTDGSVRATGPLGTYGISAAGQEHWERRSTPGNTP